MKWISSTSSLVTKVYMKVNFLFCLHFEGSVVKFIYTRCLLTFVFLECQKIEWITTTWKNNIFCMFEKLGVSLKFCWEKKAYWIERVIIRIALFFEITFYTRIPIFAEIFLKAVVFYALDRLSLYLFYSLYDRHCMRKISEGRKIEIVAPKKCVCRRDFIWGLLVYWNTFWKMLTFCLQNSWLVSE